jgi:hypothetical protein
MQIALVTTAAGYQGWESPELTKPRSAFPQAEPSEHLLCSSMPFETLEDSRGGR